MSNDITLSNLTIIKGQRCLLEPTDLVLSGIMGLVGRNGVGKSILIKTIFESLGPGEAFYLPQIFICPPQTEVIDVFGLRSILNALDRLEAGLGHEQDLEIVGQDWDAREKAQQILSEMGLAKLSLNQPYWQLSGGQQVLVRLAKCYFSSASILLLDEPTNNLDSQGKAIVSKAIRSWQGPVLFASHDRDLLNVGTRIIELEGGKLFSFTGTYQEFRRKRQEEYENSARKLEIAQDQKKQLAARIQKNREKASRRAQSGIKLRKTGSQSKLLTNFLKEAAENQQKSAKKIQERQKAHIDMQLTQAKMGRFAQENLNFEIPTLVNHSSQRFLIEIRNLSFQYPESATKVINQLNFVLSPGEKVAIEGPNGCGKSTLIQLITGSMQASDGEIIKNTKNLKLIDQKLLSLDSQQTVIQQFKDHQMSDRELKNQLARFLLPYEFLARQVSSLSGGEKFRLALAKILLQDNIPIDLMILDEPTNHLDLESIEVLEQVLENFAGALLVISHDQTFKDRLNLQPVNLMGLMIK